MGLPAIGRTRSPIKALGDDEKNAHNDKRMKEMSVVYGIAHYRQDWIPAPRPKILRATQYEV